MGRYRFSILLFFVIVTVVATCLSSCGGNAGSGEKSIGDTVEGLFDSISGAEVATLEEDPNAPDRDNTSRILVNTADDLASFSGNGATVDYSNASDGYIMAKYEGSNQKVKIQITKDNGETYTYDIVSNTDFTGFPLSQGSGNYDVAMYLNIEGDKYSQACAQAVSADITDDFLPFLRPNQYCDYSSSSQAVAKASELAEGTKSDLKVIENTFLFVTEHVDYDYEKAEEAASGTINGYIPNVDETLSTAKGICFDYASLMTCMLRAQGIPCQLVVGYAGSSYHAWISVHVEGIGWVANMIQFNNDQWTLMDPTFAAGGDTTDPNSVIGDGENYNPVYYY